nr:MAG TPA: putative tail component [Caudoviricetes sp.]
MKVKANQMVEAIAGELAEYASEVTDTVKDAVSQVAKETVSEVKRRSPTDTGAYKRSWSRQKSFESAGSVRFTIYNRKHYQLTHLLENGHAKVNGGRTRAYPHIAPAEEFAERQLEQILKRELGGSQ